MQSGQSKFLVNIVPLANVITNTSGIDTTAQLVGTVASIQQMVNIDTKTIAANYLGAYTAGNTIQVTSPISFCNTSNSSNSTTNIGTTTTFIKASSNISMAVGGNQIFSIDSLGNSLFQNASGSSQYVRVSGMNFVADNIITSTITISNTCYAKEYVTLSDKYVKEEISSIGAFSFQTLDNIQTYKFKYVGSDDEKIGILAQELEGVYPECITVSEDGTKYVNYPSLVALLLQAVRGLDARVKVLERATQKGPDPSSWYAMRD
jgi:hypothetical protein